MKMNKTTVKGSKIRPKLNVRTKKEKKKKTESNGTKGETETELGTIEIAAEGNVNKARVEVKRE